MFHKKQDIKETFILRSADFPSLLFLSAIIFPIFLDLLQKIFSVCNQQFFLLYLDCENENLT